MGLRLLIRHLEEEQVGGLLDAVAISQPVVAVNIALRPELSNETLWVAHVDGPLTLIR